MSWELGPVEYSDMSFEDFMDEDLMGASSDVTSDAEPVPKKSKKNKEKSKEKIKENLVKKRKNCEDMKKEEKADKKKSKKGKKAKEETKNKKDDEGEAVVKKSIEKSQAKERKGSMKSHKKQLEKLKDTDPSFYEFLQKEDQDLLDFNASDAEDSDDDEAGDDDLASSDGDSDVDSDDSDAPERGGKFHKLPSKLEVDSDDSEASDGEETKTKVKANAVRVTQTLVREWQASIQARPSVKSVRPVVQAFKAAVNSNNKDETQGRYVVEDSIVFNAVVRLALTSVLPAVSKILDLKEPKGNKTLNPGSSPHWKRVQAEVKSYLADVLKMLQTMKEAAVVNVVLRHVYELVPYYLVTPKILKALMKTLVQVWSEGEESSRVLAFLSIIKLVRCRQDKLLEPCLKQMYMAYVKNSKFTSPTTLPLINFMQRSLVEMYALDTDVAYQHAFVYIRQLAIHLRNAMTTQKKETLQAVCNWQFVHSLGLWTRLVASLGQTEPVSSLVFPLVQIIVGTVKLVPAPRHYPLRFHCVRMLNTISGATGVYIPVLPLLLEVFAQTDFNKKPKSVSFKPFNFAIMLKLSKTQLQEKSFREGVVDQMFELFMDNLHIHAASVGFPELTLPAVIQIKEFLKKCKVANFTKQMKQVLDRIKENGNHVTARRRKSTLDLRDGAAVDNWESLCRSEGTPLTRYYDSWRKARDRELTIGVAGRDQIVAGDRLPEIVRQKPADVFPAEKTKVKTKEEKAKADEKSRKEFSALFDQSDSDDDESRFLLKEERPKKAEKKKKKEAEEGSDSGSEYSELDDEELEMLAGSADDDDDDSEEEEEEEEGPSKDVLMDEGSDDSDDVMDGDDVSDDDDVNDGEDDVSDEDDMEDDGDIVEDFKFSDDET